MERVKYPRTLHLPYSPGISDDDKVLETDSHFYSMDEVVVTIKMDGENMTIYPDGYIHARSTDSHGNAWQKHAGINRMWSWKIPEGWRVCGENLEARHSIPYTFTKLSEYFQIFGIYNAENMCIPWSDVEKFCKPGEITEDGLVHVPVIYRGKYDKDAIMEAFVKYSESVVPQETEGFVVRNSEAFHYNSFICNVGKYVRKNHVQTDSHWTEHFQWNEIKKND